MKGFLNLDTIHIHHEQWLEALNFLRLAGKHHVEGLALFAANIFDNCCSIQKVIIPKQTAYLLENGLMYAVDGEEILRINHWLREKDLRLIAQIHSHPTLAYHSEMDDRYPIVDIMGGISIVVPYFANKNYKIQDCAVYRL